VAGMLPPGRAGVVRFANPRICKDFTAPERRGPLNVDT
jgi:hypothetical protein